MGAADFQITLGCSGAGTVSARITFLLALGDFVEV